MMKQNPLIRAISLLNELKKTKKLGVFSLMDEKDVLKFISDQAQGILANGEKEKGYLKKKAYISTITTFGEPLVRAAIELNNSYHGNINNKSNI